MSKDNLIAFIGILLLLFSGIILGVNFETVCDIKGNVQSKIFHTKYSPYYYSVKTDICFDSITQAKKHGYRAPK